MKRYVDLKILEKAGEISDLKLQPCYELQPKMNGQRAITYVADFEYRERGNLIAEDVKGVLTQVFRIKAKMFRVKYPNIELRIV